MRIETKIALRYIFSKRSFNFITVITFISILGITAGTATLIAVLSIFNGFQEITVKQIVGFDPHIRISAERGNTFAFDKNIIDNVSKLNNLKSYAPIIQGKAIAVNGSVMQVFNLSGLPEDYDEFSKEISKSMIVGQFNFNAFEDGKGIVMGAALADRLGVFPGDMIEILSPEIIENSLRTYSQPKGSSVYVAGIFQTNIKDYDLSTAFVNFNTSRSLFAIPQDMITTIDVRFNDFKKADAEAKALKSRLGNDFHIDTWIDLNNDLYQVMQFEKLASFSIVGIIIIIAVFNVLSSLAMTVTEKKQDIGLLKALGANDVLIRNIYLAEGAFIGTIGTALGSIFGIAFVYGQMYFKWFKIDTNKYIIDAIPVSPNFQDLITVVAFSMALSLLATIYPALKASKTVAIEAIRGE